jgi:5'-nucleotidase (lipoprotein e(P4) family)
MVARRFARAALALSLAALAGACATAPAGKPAQAAPPPCPTGPTFAAGADRATLWMRNSSEYRAAGETTYRAALNALRRGLADPAWTAEPTQSGDLSALPPAVVMDVDETVLDNSEAEVRLLLRGACFEAFPAAWDAWVAERAAPAVPGAVAFVQAARALKDAQGRPVRVFFITNRECERRAGNDDPCPQQADTMANLAALGLGAPTLEEDLMVRGERPDWAGEKLPRRREVARGHRIVLNVGDDLADFLPDVRRQGVAARDRARCASDAYWGERWFILPNPVYGSWLVAAGPDLAQALAAKPGVFQACPP